MKQNAVVTGADRGLGLAISARLLAEGWHVYAGQFMPGWQELESLSQQFPETLHTIPWMSARKTLPEMPLELWLRAPHKLTC